MDFRRVGEQDTSQLEYCGIVAAEHIASAIGPQARLPFVQDLIITAAQMVGVIMRDDGHMYTPSMVRLLKLEEVWAQTMPLSFGCHQVGPEHRSEIRPDYPVQGEPSTP